MTRPPRGSTPTKPYVVESCAAGLCRLGRRAPPPRRPQLPPTCARNGDERGQGENGWSRCASAGGAAPRGLDPEAARGGTRGRVAHRLSLGAGGDLSLPSPAAADRGADGDKRQRACRKRGCGVGAGRRAGGATRRTRGDAAARRAGRAGARAHRSLSIRRRLSTSVAQGVTSGTSANACRTPRKTRPGPNLTRPA